MRRQIGALCAMVLASGMAGITSRHALAANTLCVGGHSGCFSTLQAAVDAAHNGDTIRIDRGTFKGGVTVDVSVRIVGSGRDNTILKGGSSVLTIGRYNATSEPTVSISALTITGGVARSSPYSIPYTGVAGVVAAGGGVEIPSSQAGLGATVTIADTNITGNRVAPRRSLPVGPPCPGNVGCPFAAAWGGGIDNAGALKVINSTISHNLIGSASGLSNLASDAEGAGIRNFSAGTLVIDDSSVSDNHASATTPNGRFADSGGIFALGPTLTMDNDVVTHNTAELSTSMPNSVQTLAIAGGIHVSNNTSGAIRDTTISENSVSATNSVGDASASSGGLHSDGPLPLPLTNDVISENSVTATTTPASAGSAFADSGAGEIGGTGAIRQTRFIGNSVTATSSAGTAEADGGAFVAGTSPGATISGSLIRDNRLSATSTSGSAIVEGGGIKNVQQLTLRDTVVADNTGIAHGPAGIAQGGGIWNGTIPGAPPPTELTLDDSTVTGNTLTASPGITVHGGGLYTTLPVTRADSRIDDNVPDQCYGC